MAREVNEELNLTPFIGLFAMLVVLLLTTAVWNQIEALSTNASSTTSSDQPQPPQEKTVQLSVTILADRVQLAEDEKSSDIPHLPSGEPDIDQLKSRLELLRENYPEHKSIILNTDNQTPYRHMIAVFDMMMGAGWEEVGVSTQ